MHLPTHQQLRDALLCPEALRLSPMARERLRWINDFVERGCSVTETCERFGIARATFHRWLERFDVRNLSSLEDRPSDHAPRMPTVAPEIVALIRAYRQEYPLEGKQQLSERLRIEHSLTVSPSTIGRIIERECLYFANTPLHWSKRQRRTQWEQDKDNLVIPTHTPASEPAPATCPCAWCRFRQTYWPMLRWNIAFASVLANVALIGLFAWTVLWERSQALTTQPLPASVLNQSTPHSSNR